MATYTYPTFPYKAPADLLEAHASGRRHPLVVIGAGPVGLAAAIDARLQGLEVLVLDEDNSVSVGSRAVCYAKRTLEILDRLGVGDFACDRGVGWNVGRTFLQDGEVYRFDLVPDPGHKRPGMVNLQQYLLEEALVARAVEVGVDLRWLYKVAEVVPGENGVTVVAETPDGRVELGADWVVVADGARSPTRRSLGLDIEGQVFKDRFLIADVVMKADFPAERWFWFDPPFHRNQSVLLHKQSDNVWRIDFQLGWDADPEVEKRPENIIPRVQAMLGDERPFELEWASIYTFQCRRMTRFRHGRLLFVGDAAHQVSPFGARGANSGVQDTDDLMWKLALVIKGLAPQRLLDTYDQDRVYAADENIRNSTRSTDFITPKSHASRVFRSAALQLAQHHPFARKLVNSGRLSVPSFLTHSRLNTPDTDAFQGRMVPGAPVDDAPLSQAGQSTWLLDQLGGRFTLLVFTPDAAAWLAEPVAVQVVAALAQAPVPVEVVAVGTAVAGAGLYDVSGLAGQRFDARPGTCVLVRPDQHVAARWRALDLSRVLAAVQRATAQTEETPCP